MCCHSEIPTLPKIHETKNGRVRSPHPAQNYIELLVNVDTSGIVVVDLLTTRRAENMQRFDCLICDLRPRYKTAIRTKPDQHVPWPNCISGIVGVVVIRVSA